MRINILSMLGSAVIAVLLSSNVHARQAPWVGETFRGLPCPGSRQGYGPYDYTKRGNLKYQLNIVEDYHFTPDVENLRRGNTSMTPAGDLSYTLNAWPNHHRALYAISKYQLQNPEKQVLKIPVECYFQRAIAFSQKDAISYMLYGMYLHRLDKLEDAEKLYEKAKTLKPGNAEIFYNYGLLLFDMKEYGKARELANKAKKGGYPLRGLDNKLKRLNY